MRGVGQIYSDQTQALTRGVGEAHTQVQEMNKSIDDMQQRADRMRVSLKMQSDELMSSLQQILQQLHSTGDALGDAVRSDVLEDKAAAQGCEENRLGVLKNRINAKLIVLYVVLSDFLRNRREMESKENKIDTCIRETFLDYKNKQETFPAFVPPSSQVAFCQFPPTSPGLPFSPKESLMSRTPNLQIVEKEVKENKDSGDRQKALDAALTQIERAFGKGSIMKLGHGEVAEIETISTGSLGLDIGLGIGGLPRGRIIEIYGPESSGKTTLALHVIAQAQKKGGTCAFIDAEHALDPAICAEAGCQYR